MVSAMCSAPPPTAQYHFYKVNADGSFVLSAGNDRTLDLQSNGFSLNQHRGRGWPDTFNLLKHRLESRTVTHDLPELGPSIVRGPKAAILEVSHSSPPEAC